MSAAPDRGADAPFAESALVVGGNRGAWRAIDRPEYEATANGVEAWVFALRGAYMRGGEFSRRDLDAHDLVVLNLNPRFLAHHRTVLRKARERRATVVALYEGDLADLEPVRPAWQAVADLCDLVIAINGFGVGYLRAHTSTPVALVGIPYPVDGVRAFAVAAHRRRREVLLCGPLLERRLDYLAARPLDVPMLGYERTVPRRPRDMVRHRTLDRLRYVHRARTAYADPRLTVEPQVGLPSFFLRAAESALWMNLDPRYTWGRYVLDAAALGVPIVSTASTWHAPRLFPDLVVESEYDVEGATERARRLLDDPVFYADVVARAAAGLDWYRAEPTVRRLREALGTAPPTPAPSPARRPP